MDPKDTDNNGAGDAADAAGNVAPPAGDNAGGNEPPKKSTREIELEAENVRIRGANKTLNDKVVELEAQPDPGDGGDGGGDGSGADEFSAMSTDQLRNAAKTNPAAKAWLDLIGEEATKAAKAATQPQREAVIGKAKAKLMAAHPDYATDAGKEKLDAMMSVAKNNGLNDAVDEESAFDILRRAHAFNNPDAKVGRTPEQRRTNEFAANQANAHDSEPIDDGDYTEAEHAQAKEHNCTPEEARKAMKVYG